MRRSVVVSSFLAVVALLGPAVTAETLSKTYEFKQGVTLELGQKTSDGLRLDNIRFQLPKRIEGTSNRTGGLAGALVAVSNVGDGSRVVGVAIALFDGEGRLVGVGSAGTKMLPLKPGRQKSYVLIFDHVNERVYDAERFQITLESK